MNHFDVIIIGAGMAGSSAAAELAKTLKVLVLEQETQPGYHSTGRSAAVYSVFYGSDRPAIFALTVGSNDFYETPPEGFTEHCLRKRKGALFVGPEDKLGELEQHYEKLSALHSGLALVERDFIKQHLPVLKESYCRKALWDEEIYDLDVHAIQTGFLKSLKARGGLVKTNRRVESMQYSQDKWHLHCCDEEFTAAVVVNAAGAWCDEIAALAKVNQVGLQALRRTAILIDAPEGANPDAWPMVGEFQEAFYFKPDAGKIMVSPADEIPSAPCDAQPDELDIALTVEHIENATDIEVNKINHSWAGLRSFVKDRSPVIGFAQDKPGFFWLAGQGGYGIQTAPAAGRLAASLVTGEGIPTDLVELGLKDDMISSARQELA